VTEGPAVNTNYTAARRPLIATSHPLQATELFTLESWEEKVPPQGDCPIVFSKQLQAIGGQRAAVLLEPLKRGQPLRSG